MPQTLKCLKALFVQRLAFQPMGESEQQFFMLLEEYAGISKLQYLMDSEGMLAAVKEASLMAALDKLEQQQPVQQILGYAQFCGLNLKVNEAVLIPRPETEELLELITNTIGPFKRVLDVGTGSGCLAIALAKKQPKATVYASDVSAEALDLAKQNAKDNNLSVEFLLNNVLEESHLLPKGLDLVVSNPPYIRESEKEAMQANVLNFEPHLALFVANQDPLFFYRKISAFAKEALLPEGWLAFEINQYLGTETKALVESYGFTVSVYQDSFENNRFILAQKLEKDL